MGGGGLILTDYIGLNGVVNAKVYRSSELESEQTVKNLTVTAGRNLLRDLLAGEGRYLSKFAIGTATTPSTPANTRLGAEVWRANITAIDRTVNGQLRVVYFLPTTAANNNTLQEVGLFGGTPVEDKDSGTMYARAVLSQPIEKTTDVSVEFTWILQFEAVK